MIIYIIVYIYIGLYVRINNVGHLNSQHEGFLSHGGGSKIWIPQIQMDQKSDDKPFLEKKQWFSTSMSSRQADRIYGKSM